MNKKNIRYLGIQKIRLFNLKIFKDYRYLKGDFIQTGYNKNSFSILDLANKTPNQKISLKLN